MRLLRNKVLLAELPPRGALGLFSSEHREQQLGISSLTGEHVGLEEREPEQMLVGGQRILKLVKDLTLHRLDLIREPVDKSPALRGRGLIAVEVGFFVFKRESCVIFFCLSI